MTPREAATQYRDATQRARLLQQQLSALEDKVAVARTQLWAAVQWEMECREALLSCVEASGAPGD